MSQFLIIKHDEDPISCALWQFHVCFLYATYLQVVSLVTSQVVYTKVFPFKARGIDFNIDQLIVYGNKAPILVSSVENESIDVWR